MSSLAHAEHTRTPEPHKLRTLVLNSNLQPIATWPLSLVPAQEAVKAIVRDRAYSVEDWPESFFRSPSITIPAPKVVVLKEMARVHGRPKFCRRSVFLRDKFICQFCGQRFPSSELTFDHYIPRAKGGKTVFENVLTACVPCNAKKKDGYLRPIHLPYNPTTAELIIKGLDLLPDDQAEDFRSWLYWETPLDP